MAIYRLETKIIGRGTKNGKGAPRYKQGVSVVAKAAYRSGDRLKDARLGMTFNYRYKSDHIIGSDILVPEQGRGWLQFDKFTGKLRELRQELWNAVERAEKRSDAQLAREMLAALPKELSEQQNMQLVREWTTEEFVSRGYVVDFSLHRPTDGGENVHAHILIALRPIDANGFGKKPSTDGKFNGRGAVGQGAKADLALWRKSWERFANLALEKAGRSERIDHRSLKDRGVDVLPTPKIGPNVMAMQRRGAIEDHARLEEARYVQLVNESRPLSRAIEIRGEVAQVGVGATWWERSITFMSRIREKVMDTVKDYWRKFIDADRSQSQKNEQSR